MNHIGTWQCFVVYCVFLFGNIATIGGTNEAGRDAYIAFFLAGLIALPLYKLYFWILYSNAQNLSKVRAILAKALTLFMGASSLHVAAISLSTFVLFLSENTLLVTPNLFINIFVTLTILVLCRNGISSLARLCELIFWVVILLISASNFSALKEIDPTNMLPFFRNGLTTLLSGVFTSLFIPFAEGLFAMFVICSSAQEKSAKKGIYGATIFTTLVLTFTFFKNIAVLGYPLVGLLYFPTYSVSSLITLGSFLQRMEVLIAIAFIFCQLVKGAILVLFAHKCFCNVFGKKEQETPITVPVLIVFNLSAILFSGITEAFLWLPIYRYYLIPCTILAPLLLKLVLLRKQSGQKLTHKQRQYSAGD